MKLGSTVTIAIEAGNVPNAVIVPLSALLASDEGGEKVMVALPDGHRPGAQSGNRRAQRRRRAKS